MALTSTISRRQPIDSEVPHPNIPRARTSGTHRQIDGLAADIWPKLQQGKCHGVVTGPTQDRRKTATGHSRDSHGSVKGQSRDSHMPDDLMKSRTSHTVSHGDQSVGDHGRVSSRYLMNNSPPRYTDNHTAGSKLFFCKRAKDPTLFRGDGM